MPAEISVTIKEQEKETHIEAKGLESHQVIAFVKGVLHSMGIQALEQLREEAIQLKFTDSIPNQLEQEPGSSVEPITRREPNDDETLIRWLGEREITYSELELQQIQMLRSSRAVEDELLWFIMGLCYGRPACHVVSMLRHHTQNGRTKLEHLEKQPNAEQSLVNCPEWEQPTAQQILVDCPECTSLYLRDLNPGHKPKFVVCRHCQTPLFIQPQGEGKIARKPFLVKP